MQPERDLDVRWRPISLLFKNDPPEDSPYYASSMKTHRMLRVIEAVRAAATSAGQSDDDVFRLYWELGARIHHDGDLDFDIADALATVGLGTAQRNLSAALVVGGQNFSDTPGVITFIIVAGIVGLIVLLPAAGEIGKRTAPTS